MLRKMRANEFITEKWSQKYKKSINCSNPKGFSQKAHCAGRKKHNENADPKAVQLSVQQLATISDEALDAAYHYGRSKPGNTFGWQANLKSAEFAKQVIDKGVTDIEAISDAIHNGWNETARAFVKNPMMFDDSKTMAPEKLEAKIAQRQKLMTQQYAQLPEDEKEKDRVVARAMLQAITGGQQDVAEDTELAEEFDLIESIIKNLAEKNQVDSEVIWKDLESLTDDELYVFAVTTPVMEDWQKVNKKDKTDGMSRKAVNAYRREHPGSKLKTAVTTKPSKLKKGSKASKRRSSYCSRSAGQKKMHHIDCSKTPDKAICKARRRWNC